MVVEPPDKERDQRQQSPRGPAQECCHFQSPTARRPAAILLRLDPPTDRYGPTAPMLRIEPALPMLRIDPALPTLRIEPALPTLSRESTLRMLYALNALAKLRRLRQLGTAWMRCRLRPIAASISATACTRDHFEASRNPGPNGSD